MPKRSVPFVDDRKIQLQIELPECLKDGSRDFVSTLSKCHMYMRSNGVVPLKEDLLPLHPFGFWEFYGKKSPGSGLQKLLSAQMEAHVASEMLIRADKSKMEKARLRSIRGKQAGAWLSTLPTSPALTLSDQHFRVASRLRLGLPPQEHLPSTCKCGASLPFLQVYQKINSHP